MRTIKECEQVAREHGGKLGWFPLLSANGRYGCVIGWPEGEMRLARGKRNAALAFCEDEKRHAYNLAADWAEKHLKPKGE